MAMANSLLTINMITREAVRLWKNSNAFIQNIDMQYDESFAVSGAKIGTSLRIRLPNDFTVTTGPALSVQDTSEQSTTLVLATQKHVDVSYSTQERTMSLDDYSRRVLAPMVNNLAGAVALDVMSGIEGGICNFTANQDVNGTILNPIASTYLDAGASLDLNSAPIANRKIVNGPRTEARVVASLSGLLNPASQISDQYITGRMYDALGFIWMKDQTALSHTTGTLAQGSATVSGAGQTGLLLTVAALAGTLVQGDIITIAGVFAVNRITKQSTGELRQFVVTANVAAGATSIPIYPAIVPGVGGQAVQYQTVVSSPADGAAVNPANGLAASTNYRKNFAYAPDAVTLATADLEMPKNVHEAAREEFDGVSMRMVTDYFIGTDQLITRLDVLYGYLWIRPEWACIVADAV
ncbi:MAG: P22 phage major capsid protein family protein [Armatimonadia bacterium]